MPRRKATMPAAQAIAEQTLADVQPTPMPHPAPGFETSGGDTGTIPRADAPDAAPAFQNCPQCEGTIPRNAFSVTRIKDKKHHEPKWLCRVWCEHCQKGWQLVVKPGFEGEWRMVGSMDQVKDGGVLRTLMERAGVTQRAS